jgi:hypothetical protein
MVDKSKQVDLAGNTLIVEKLHTGATKTGQQGTEFSFTAPNVASITTDVLVIDATEDITIPSAAVATAGTGAGSAGASGGAVATHVLPITVGATTYYIPLCNTNA